MQPYEFITDSSNEQSVNMDETDFLLNNPRNTARLLESISDYENGLGQVRILIEE